MTKKSIELDKSLFYYKPKVVVQGSFIIGERHGENSAYEIGKLLNVEFEMRNNVFKAHLTRSTTFSDFVGSRQGGKETRREGGDRMSQGKSLQRYQITN